MKAVAFKEGLLSSNVSVLPVVKYDWLKGQSVGKVQPGLAYKYYEPDSYKLETIAEHVPIKTGTTPTISLAAKEQRDGFAFIFTGYVKIDKAGLYDFSTFSDDGSGLWLDSMRVVDNGGYHGQVEKNGAVALKQGYHRSEVRYFNSSGEHELKVFYQPKVGKKKELTAAMLYH